VKVQADMTTDQDREVMSSSGVADTRLSMQGSGFVASSVVKLYLRLFSSVSSAKDEALILWLRICPYTFITDRSATYATVSGCFLRMQRWVIEVAFRTLTLRKNSRVFMYFGRGFAFRLLHVSHRLGGS